MFYSSEKSFLNSLRGEDIERAEFVLEQLNEIMQKSDLDSLGCELYVTEIETYKDCLVESQICKIWINNQKHCSLETTPFRKDEFIYLESENYKQFGKFKKRADEENLRDITVADYNRDANVHDFVDKLLVEYFPKYSADILKTIASSCPKLPLSVNTIVNPANKTVNDVLTQRGKYPLINSARKYPFIYSLMLRELSKVFPQNCLSKFYGKDAIQHCLAAIDKAELYSLKSLMLIGACEIIYPGIDSNVVSEYIMQCKRLKTEPSWHIKSENKMILKLQDLSRFTTAKKGPMSVAKIYKDLEKRLGGNYKLLKTSEQMVCEGLRQRNCVANYINSVNRKWCGIFTYDYNNSHYTIEVRFDPKLGYYCSQFLGYKNQSDQQCQEQEKLFENKLIIINSEFTCDQILNDALLCTDIKELFGTGA